MQMDRINRMSPVIGSGWDQSVGPASKLAAIRFLVLDLLSNHSATKIRAKTETFC